MDRIKKKRFRRNRIKLGIRKKITGTEQVPRLSVFRSNANIYGQIINDITGITICSVGTLKPDFDTKGKSKTEIAKIAGQRMAEKALENNITKVVFDRNGFLYHGRIKAFAEGVREGGVQF